MDCFAALAMTWFLELPNGGISKTGDNQKSFFQKVLLSFTVSKTATP
jgi:hypothetical protein